MRLKKGVVMQGLQECMRPVLIAAEKIWNSYGKELVITETLGSIHSAGSWHYYGKALDLRTRYFSNGQCTLIVEELKKVLGYDYDVVMHGTHMHVEHDPK